jgi:hypothetical protein
MLKGPPGGCGNFRKMTGILNFLKKMIFKSKIFANQQKKNKSLEKNKKIAKKVMIKKNLEKFYFLKNVKVKIFENFCWKFKYLDSLEMLIWQILKNLLFNFFFAILKIIENFEKFKYIVKNFKNLENLEKFCTFCKKKKIAKFGKI